MQRVLDILGLPVINVDSGKQIGNVKDIWFDDERFIQAFVLEDAKWFTAPRSLASRQIETVGADALTVRGECVKVDNTNKGRYSLCGAAGVNAIRGLPMLTDSGNRLGTIEDVYLDVEAGMRITGFELSEGFISDLTEGRKWLPEPSRVTIGEDAVIVPEESEQHLRDLLPQTKE